jgi:hypothetical protein
MVLFVLAVLCAAGLQGRKGMAQEGPPGYPDFDGDGVVSSEDMIQFMAYWHYHVFLDRDGEIQVEITPTPDPGGTPPPTPTPTPIVDRVAAIPIHDAAVAGADYGRCTECHGKRYNEVAPFVGNATTGVVLSAHSRMLHIFPGSEAGVNDSVCVGCHKTVDLFHNGGGALRKKVAIDQPGLLGLTCSSVACHGASGSKPFYLINK